MFEKLSERFTRIFERPAPLVSCNIESIDASSPPGFFDGYFIIKNIGGGNLEGDIFAQSSFINLPIQTIEGNDVIIEYEIDLKHLNPGDTFTSQIVLTTSGGQYIIPVRIEIEPYSVMCGEYKLYSLVDFCNCVRTMPNEACELFVTDKFERWLTNSKCGHMEFYRKMIGGESGLKEVDSFLTACGLKEKAVIKIKKKNIEISVSPDDTTVEGCIPLACTSWGIFEYKVKTNSKAPWLKISKSKVSNTDFKNDEYTYVFMVETKLLNATRSKETIVYENNQETLEVNVTVFRPKLFTVKLSRLSYKNEDSGYLVCNNYTGKNALIEVSSTEKFVRFKASKYMVENTVEIPFEIKVNSFLNLGFGKKPVNMANVYLRTVIDGSVYTEKVTIKAGSLFSV